ncbi:MAG: hypothetical protein QHI48_06295 [Bacteroidota bacterium]|nr:hypothetical protein [Bacteroidota bacterium]
MSKLFLLLPEYFTVHATALLNKVHQRPAPIADRREMILEQARKRRFSIMTVGKSFPTVLDLLRSRDE